jgi:hypothetical protein
VCKPNKPSWTTTGREKREIKQRRQESAERDKEHRKLGNVRKKVARKDKDEWLPGQ